MARSGMYTGYMNDFEALFYARENCNDQAVRTFYDFAVKYQDYFQQHQAVFGIFQQEVAGHAAAVDERLEYVNIITHYI